MSSLIVCEKPKVAQKVADALSGGKAERKAKFGVSYYELERNGKKIFVAPAVGHIYTLRQISKGSQYPVFDIEWAPSWEVEKGSEFTKNYLHSLESIAKGCDEFVNSCDFDVEGSLIGYNVIRFACKSKTGKRMKFSALTEEDLIEAYESAGPLDESNAVAGETRHILDWYWGINMSRALMHAIRSTGMYKVMSIGRVQGPALHILATKEREIAAFVSQPYWQLFAIHDVLRFLHEKEKFFKKEEAELAKANSEAHLGKATVTSVTRTEKKIPPNPPFDLTSLQVEAYKCFGFSPSATLAMAQTLYEGSLISYPRTSSQKLPAKLNLPKLLQKLAENPAYAERANSLLKTGKTKPHEGGKEDPAHPAIHPTGLRPSRDLGEREFKLYDLIAKRFLAVFADFAVREGMRVNIAIGPETFFVTGARTVSAGWIDFYAPYAKFEEEHLPDFKQGEAISISKIEMEEKETQPPKRYTEASVIQALEKKNLGTKATRAVVIETLHKRGYLKGARSVEVTPFGLKVDGSLSAHCPEITDEKLTRAFEKEVDLISRGKLAAQKVIAQGQETLTTILEKFKAQEKDIGLELVDTFKEQRREDETLGPCPNCGKDMRVLRNRASGKQFTGCSGYPDCRTTYPLPQMALVIKTGAKCATCNTPIITVRRKARRDFDMCLDPRCPTKANWGQPKSAPAPSKAPAAPAVPPTDSASPGPAAPAVTAAKPAAKPKPVRKKAAAKKSG